MAKPKPAPPPPPEPVALPSPRVRVADLASSMLKGALLTAALTYPASLMLEIDASRSPEWVSFLFATTLLGVWGALAAGKAQESLSLGRWPRRGLSLVTGAAVGLACTAFGSWVGLGPLSPGDAVVASTSLSAMNPLDPKSLLLFFSVVALISGWPSLATYNRPRRFRFWPLFASGVTAGLLGSAASSPEPMAIVVAVLTVGIVQLVAPWSAPAASYARYLAKAGKQQRKMA